MSLEAASAADQEASSAAVAHRVTDAGTDREPAENEGEGAERAHPVRDRLLARARAAERFRSEAEQSSSAPADPDDLLGSLTDELDRVGTRRRPPSAPSLGAGRRDLPPNLIALFATLCGLALLTALFAVLIHVDPRDGTPVARTQAPTSPAAPSAAPLPAPKAGPPPGVGKSPRKKVPGPWRIADSTDARLRKIEGTIGRTSFLKAIEAAGVPNSQGFRLLKSMQGLRDFDRCNPRDRFAALVDRAASRLVAFEYAVSKEEIFQAREGDDGLLKAVKLDLKVERARVQGAIRLDRETLAASIEAGGFEPGLASVLDDALEGHMSVADLQRGDRLRVVAQEVTVLGEFARYAGIEALELVPAHGNDKPLRIYYFQGPRSRGYYDALGRSVHEGGWRRPIKGAPITSRFNPKRMHPILKKVMPHNGTDFGAPTGTPVGSVGSGTVKFIGYAGANGNFVSIGHAGGIESGYSHLSRFEAGLKVGDRVTATQVVGYVGSTGRSTGPHLHFSIKKDGVFIDPESLKFDALRILPADELAEFMEARTRLDAMLNAVSLPAGTDAAPAPAPLAPAASSREEYYLEGEAGESATAPEDEEPGLEPELDERPSIAMDPGAAPPPAAPAAASLAPPAPPPPAAVPAPPQAPPPRSGSLYLSDQELLRTQPATDDGEVEE